MGPVAWSLKDLLERRWPERDHIGEKFKPGTLAARRAGQHLAGGLCAVVWSLKQDLEHLSKAYNLRHHNANELCDFCPANSGAAAAMRWNNFHSGATWKSAQFTKEEWLALPRAKPLHQLFTLPYLSNINLDPDELHIIYLGTAAHIAGSILWYLCYERLPASPTENIHRLWECIAKHYRTLGTATQFGALTLSSFTDHDKPRKHWPKLKGRGAEIRDIQEPLLMTYKELRKAGDVDDDRIIGLLESQVQLQTIFSDNAKDTFLSKETAVEVRRIIDNILQLYTLLANSSDRRHTLLFNIVPKFHFLWHLGFRAYWLNPRKGCTMVDEDYVGVVKHIVASCVHGCAPRKVPIVVMEKVIWGQYFMAVYGDAYSR